VRQSILKFVSYLGWATVPPAAQQDDWRRKYFDSIAAIEEEARQYRRQQQVLFKLLTRLCAAAQGQAPGIDAELKRLRDAVRREAKVEELEPFGDAIAQAVREHEGAVASTASVTPIAIAAPEAPVVKVIQQVVPVASPAQVRQAGPERDNSFAGGEELCGVLLRLLAEVRQEPELQAEVSALEAELAAPLTGGKAVGVVQKVGGLLVQRIHDLEKAAQGMAVLLEQMVGQLDGLNAYIRGQSEEETRRTQSSDALNLQITGEVRAIGESVQSSNDLELLRLQLSERLASIGKHLQSFRDREQEHARQSRERAARMRARMQEMENEAKALQVKLSDEQRQSLLDTLTRIPNRLAWEQRIGEELSRWPRFQQPTCVLAWDIDGFKGINDRYGHRAGDKVLVVVAELLATGIRGTDFVARYGGEEFVMLLPATSLESGMNIANQMRESIAETGFHFRGSPVSVTISCGITVVQERDTAEEVFDRADRAMYQAKNGGRNKVVSG
jgi:diguanylate cyclase